MEPLNFTIRIDLPTGMFRLNVERIYAGDGIEKFRISGGNRSFVLQSNRPALLAEASRKPIEWKILELPFVPLQAIETTTYALHKVMQEIELYLKLEQQKAEPSSLPDAANTPASLPELREGQLRLF
jgi:hypothetical protein